jgi:membrane-bound ClpP family serine protease
MSPLVWAAALLAIGFALAVLEVFFVSGGIFGFLSLAAVVTSIIVAFREGPLTGSIFLGVTIVLLPTVLLVALQWWPHTAMGRRVLLPVPDSRNVLPDSPRQRELKQMIGRVGKAKSPMMPGGVVVIEGRTIDAVTQGMAVEVGQVVRVVEVRGNRVVVRPVEGETITETPGDDLSRPIDSVGLDPFQDPPA